MNRRLSALVVVCLAASTMPAADWPQWRGPNRDEISPETGLLKTWPEGGPRRLWTFEKAGAGYSGPAVVGKTLYSAGADDKQDFVFALDTETGREKWRVPLGGVYQQNRGDGPRGTPTVDGGALYLIRGGGEVHCLDAKTGKQRWEKRLTRDLGGRLMSGWGYSESPLIDGDKLICTPGGRQGTLAALDKATGKLLWQSKDVTDPAGYSSAIVAEVGGVRQYVQQTGNGVIGVRAKDGKLLWRHEKDNYRTAVIPTPVFHDDHVFVTSGYGAGCTLLKLSPDGPGGTKAQQVYANRNMVNHHGGVVLLDGYVYGHSDSGGWTCLDFQTGQVKWENRRGLDKGSLTYADGHLYCYGESSGKLVRVAATPSGWKEAGSFTIPKETKIRRPNGRIWTHPVVADGKLFLRDQDLLFGFDLKNGAVSQR